MIGLALTVLALMGGADDKALQRRPVPAIPAIYHGYWAANLQECRALDGAYREITARSIVGYEYHGRPLRVSAIRNHRTPRGEAARTVIVRMAWQFEGEPETYDMRMSLVGDRIMMSNAADETEASHFAEGWIRCPPGVRPPVLD